MWRAGSSLTTSGLGRNKRQQGQKAGAIVLATQASASAPKGVSIVKVKGRDPAHSFAPLRVRGRPCMQRGAKRNEVISHKGRSGG